MINDPPYPREVDGASVRDEGVITLVCSLPEQVNIDVETLQRLLKSRLEARAARAEEEVEITARLLGDWAREELEALVGQLVEARQHTGLLH